MKQTWLEQMSTLQRTMVKESPFEVSDELYDAVMLFKNAQSEVHKRASKTTHISPYWSEASRLLMPAINPEILCYTVFSEIAERCNRPVTWIYLLPFSLQIDHGARHISFKDKEIKYLDSDGCSTELTLMAFQDGKDEGLVDEDEPFLFANSDMMDEFIESAETYLGKMADELGVNFDTVMDIISGNIIEAPFPHENDDSPVGEE